MKKKTTMKEKVWKFFDSHPKALMLLDMIDVVSSKFMLIYTVFFAVVLIGIPVFLVYIALPEDVRGELAAILGTLLSVVVMPLVLNNYNRKRDDIAKRYDANSEIYVKLSDLLVTILTHRDNTVDNTRRVQEYIRIHYSQMCISFSTGLISNLYAVYRNCKSGNYENVAYFGEKCLMTIRRECGVGKEFQFSSLMLDAIQEKTSSEEENVPVVAVPDSQSGTN
jgi:hypothetical protein